MPRQKLATIDGVKAELIPPPRSVAVGSLPDGRVIYEREEFQTVKSPRLHPITKEPVWRKNPKTGELMHQIFDGVQVSTGRKQFVLKRTEMGNVFIVYNFRESPEELARRARVKLVKDTQEQLATALVDEGISVADLVARLRATPVAEPEPAAKKKGGKKKAEWPKQVDSDYWELSNGDPFEGSEEAAYAAEAAIA